MYRVAHEKPARRLVEQRGRRSRTLYRKLNKCKCKVLTGYRRCWKWSQRCQQWGFQWRFWFVPSVPGNLREEEAHKKKTLRISWSIGATIYSYLNCIVYDKLLKLRQSFWITLYILVGHTTIFPKMNTRVWNMSKTWCFSDRASWIDYILITNFCTMIIIYS